MSKLVSSDEELQLLKRFRAIEKWCDRREIVQMASFFTGADTSITDEEQRRMGYVKRTKAPRMFDTDDKWIGKCEAVVALFPKKAAA